eukprot:c1436_g1_i1 orf=164-346(+)
MDGWMDDCIHAHTHLHVLMKVNLPFMAPKGLLATIIVMLHHRLLADKAKIMALSSTVKSN